jgi:hypothetical protein
MTLNLTLLTAEAIYQCADFRLTDGDSRLPLDNPSMKLVTVHYSEWEGFVTYTGVGRWRGRDTSEWIVDWLTGMQEASPDEVIERIREEGTDFLRTIERAPGGRRYSHTFVLAAFVDGEPLVATISNFEKCSGLSDDVPAAELAVDTRVLGRRPTLLVTGQKAAVPRASKRRLERVAERPDISPARLRNELTSINAEAANSAAAGGTVSAGCSVASFRRDGTGFQDLTEGGFAQPRSLMYGTPIPDIAALVGGNPGQVVGMSFSRSGPTTERQPYAPCVPRMVTPADAAGYQLFELTHPELGSARALDINGDGKVAGAGTRRGQPGADLVCVWDADHSAELIGFIGAVGPRCLNERGQICATADMSDQSVHAIRWTPGQLPEDLGTIHGMDSEEFADSGALAINNVGVVVGWVSVSTDRQDRGQGNNRPAAWIPGQAGIFLTDLPFAWGQGVDVNDDGIVLVLAYTEGVMGRAKALLWDPIAGTYSGVGGDQPDGVFPMGLTSDRVVLGNGANQSGDHVACISKAGESWTGLGTPPGWYATAINDDHEVAGSLKVEGFDRPWIRRADGTVLWLPYLEHHYCRPNSMRGGLLAGTAQTDHGTHALLWRRPSDAS